MEAGNRGAVEAGAVSVGLGVELPYEQRFNDYVPHALEFNYFFARKTMFLKYAQAYLIFPGGWGTMDEMMEALTLMQTDKIQHFPIIKLGRTDDLGIQSIIYRAFEHVQIADAQIEVGQTYQLDRECIAS